MADCRFLGPPSQHGFRVEVITKPALNPNTADCRFLRTYWAKSAWVGLKLFKILPEP